MSLQTKISVWVLVILVIIGVAVTYAVGYFQRQASVAEFTQVSSALATTVKNSLRQDMLTNSRGDIQGMVSAMGRGTLINEIMIFSPNRKVAFSNVRDDGESHGDDVDLDAVFDTALTRTRYETRFGAEEFCMLLPVENERACFQCHGGGKKVLGVIEVGLKTGPLTSHIAADTRSLVLIQLVGLALVLVNLSVAMRRTVVARLDRMLQSIRRITAGSLSERVKVDSHDEVGQLGLAFNEMQDTVEATIDELGRTYQQLDRSLLRFGKLLGTTLNINDMADLILNELADAVGSSQACLFLRQSATDALLLLASRGVFQEVVTEYNTEPVTWGTPPYSSSTFRSDAMAVSTAEEKQSMTEIARCHGSDDFYIFTLISAENVVGLLTLAAAEGGLSDSQIHTLQALCHEAATGVQSAQMHEQLALVSITDELTQTYNQRHFFTVLREEMARAKRSDGAFSIVFLDLDNFKLFNDTFGHLAGDVVLRQVSALLAHLVRASDRIFRYGGDEFVLVLPDTSRESAVVLATRVRDEIARRTFIPRGETAKFRLTASIGVTTFDSLRFGKEDQVFKAVDDALYRAKEAGRNRVVVG